jgi:SAM-dependent methyltransferase
MVGSLLLSAEFQRRYAAVSPDGGFVPRDTQINELANPAKWDNPEWMKLLRELAVLPDHKLSMHRKSYEFVQLLYGLGRLGRVRDDVSVLSVGAGHECVLYWLANRVARVVGTDLYEGVWQSVQAQEGDANVIRRPEEYAPFPYRTERLSFLKMNGLQLGFGDGTFDVAYSLSSVEHFGGLAGASAALDEMARVVKPGGLIVVATEYLLSGPPHEEVFTPAEVRELCARPGLRLVEPIDERVYARYEYVPINLYGNPHQTPHMVVRMDDSVFTTVMAFLEKSPPR